jgi:hypothetical protein
MTLLEARDRNARVTLRAPYPYDIVLVIYLKDMQLLRLVTVELHILSYLST